MPLSGESVPDRIVREEERQTITNVSRSTALRMERLGRFPRRRVLAGGRAHGWLLSELLDWVEGLKSRGETA